MRYFHRTALSPDAVLQQADRFFGNRFTGYAKFLKEFPLDLLGGLFVFF